MAPTHAASHSAPAILSGGGLRLALLLACTLAAGCGPEDTAGSAPTAPGAGAAPAGAGAASTAGAAGAAAAAGTPITAGTGGSSGAGGAPTTAAGGTPSTFTPPTGPDPGTEPWSVVPRDQVRDLCGLDVAALEAAEAGLPTPWLIVRHGLLCYETAASATMAPSEAYSTTKTLGALVTGMVAYETGDLPVTGPKTGPFSDADRADAWLDAVPYHADALVAHVLSMTATSPSLAFGSKQMVYDTIGENEINTLSTMLNAAIRQDSARLGADLEQFTQRKLFAPLGMRSSVWNSGLPDKIFAYTWSTTARDMARVGLLMLHGGVWSGQRMLDADWIYRMTHPAFEDANTGYGYLTWLNASSNHHFGGIPGAAIGDQQQPMSPGPCAPVAVWPGYPHTFSEAPDCGYSPPYSCAKTLDVGVWQAVGLGGQVIQGHPGLDMVVVGRELTPLGPGPDAPRVIWDFIRRGVINADPTFAGDEAGFCQAYGANEYAPDL